MLAIGLAAVLLDSPGDQDAKKPDPKARDIVYTFGISGFG